MDVTPLVKSGTQIIQSYADGGFRVSGQRYEGAVIVQPEGTQSWGFDGALDDLGVDDFKDIIKDQSGLDVVLLGCGKDLKSFPAQLRLDLRQAGLSVDVMDTGAACRTYNVLMAEGRRVAAILLPASR